MRAISDDLPIAQQLAQLDAADPEYAAQFVDLLLSAARSVHASDVHVQPTAQGLEIRWRLDGVLQRVGTFPPGEAADVAARLKVMAGLLTYRQDVPQEGRIREAAEGVEMRVSTFPSLHGERAVIRLFAAGGSFQLLDDLQLPQPIVKDLRRLLTENAGMLLVTGPAGSGKTTTAYALLREIVRQSAGGKSIVSLEDPIEVAVEGVSQSQVHASTGFDWPTGLRSLMRQDPEVIMIGEIRDRETAEAAFQAALTGHLVVTTFHAGSAAGAISRLSDMGIEPYMLRSGILTIVNQRLVRRLCRCARDAENERELLGLPAARGRVAVGCGLCFGSGYQGRAVIAELLLADRSDVGRAVLSRSDAAQLETLAVQGGMITRWQRASELVEAGVTSPAEIRRVLGLGDGQHDGGN